MGKKKRNKSAQAVGSTTVATEIRQVTTTTTTTREETPRNQSNSLPATTRTGLVEWLLLAASSVISFFVLATRFTGVNVSVLKDEYIYVLDSHYKDVSGFRLPNELFQFVFSSTKLCGENFYDCARGLNAAFVVGGALFIYFLVKLVTQGNRWLPALAGLATIFGTNGTYAAYYLPEAIFNFVMIGFFFLLIKYGQSSAWQWWVGMGAVFALASLAKPHAFFVLPAVLIYVALAARWSEGKYIVTVLKRTALLVGSIYSLNILISWLSQRDRPTDVFGTYGGSGRTPVAIVQDSGLQILTALPGTALGQTLVMVMTIGLTLPVAAIAVFSMLGKIDAETFGKTKAGVLIGLAIANMMAVTAVFEAWIELFIWMHTRYYSYLIPLALVVLAEAWARGTSGRFSWLRAVVIGIFTIISGYAFLTTAAPYSTNWVDAPDFKFHIDNPAFSGFLIVTTLIAGLIYLFHARSALLVGFVILFAAYLGAGQHITSYLFEKFGVDIVSDDVARILREALPQDQVDRTVLVGPGVVEMDRALFGTLSGSARAHVTSGVVSDLSFIQPDDLWVVALGDVQLEGLGPVSVSGLGFSMYALSEEIKIEPRMRKEFQLSSPCNSPENLGWACGPETSIDWNGEISGGAIVDVIFEVSGDGQKVAFALGTSQIEGVFSEGTWATTIRVSGQGLAPQLRILSTSESLEVKKNDRRLVRVLYFKVNR
jgi:phosphoglycerol transferase